MTIGRSNPLEQHGTIHSYGASSIVDVELQCQICVVANDFPYDWAEAGFPVSFGVPWYEKLYEILMDLSLLTSIL